MKISLNLLRTLIDCDWSYDKIAEKLTLSGTEVEAMETKGTHIAGITTARVLSVEPVKGSTKLTKCLVTDGRETLQVICGAPNVAKDQMVLFAPVGSTLPGKKLDKATIHGVESNGMILSEAELALSDEAATIAVLPADIKPGIPLEKYVNYKDVIFELEITPNRPDCLSHIGIARELQALGGGTLRCPDVALHEIAEQASAAVSIKIDDPDGCPRYTGRVIRNVKVGPSPIWLKVMVYYLGMRPINNVVDITNFVMMELGHPLHAFDYDLFQKPDVVVRHAKDGEKFITLDNIERKLNKDHLLITDGVEGMALAGIMGGLKSEVSDKTSNVLLESAYFDPVTIRRGSKAIGLASESSRRFERGADPNMAPKANDRACKLISDLCGGVVLKGIVDTHPKPFVPTKISLRTSRVELILGAKIRSEKIEKILSDLDIKAQSNGDIVAVQPSFRPDLTREIDLIEEIARVYGFDNIPSDFRPGGELATPETKLWQTRAKVRAYLSGAGLCEIFPITLADSRIVDKMGITDRSIRLMNPLSEEMSIIRPSLIATLLPVIKRNLGFRETNLALFEIGDVYQAAVSGKAPSQRTNLGITLAGMEFPDFWGARWRPRDIYSLKGLLEDFADYLQIGPVSLKPAPYFAFENDYSFEVYFMARKIGYMGKLSNIAADIADAREPVYVAELDLEDLTSMIPDSISTKELARFPSADRDIAVMVDDSIFAEDIRQEIIASGGELVNFVWIFDQYRGKNIPSGKKSLAFGIKYRLPDRTLTDDEVNEAQNRIVTALQNKFGAELRK